MTRCDSTTKFSIFATVVCISVLLTQIYCMLMQEPHSQVSGRREEKISKSSQISNKNYKDKFQHVSEVGGQVLKKTDGNVPSNSINKDSLKLREINNVVTKSTEERNNNNQQLPQKAMSTPEEQGSIDKHLTNNVVSKSNVNNRKETIDGTKPSKTETCKKRLPQAIIAGHYKSGTGALMTFLDEHPQLFLSLIRSDVRFFNKFYMTKGIKWYRSIMPCTYENQITLEKSAQYFTSKAAVARIYDANPNMKIILILKDPVKVAISLYAMWAEHKQNNAHKYSFESMVTKWNGNALEVNSEAKIIEWCSYVVAMKRWLNIFNRDQLLILDGNTFDKNPSEGLRQIETFLNVEPFFSEEKFVYNSTKGKYCFRRSKTKVHCLPDGKGRPHPEVSSEVIQLLTNYFQPLNKLFFKLINQTFTW